MEVMKT